MPELIEAPQFAERKSPDAGTQRGTLNDDGKDSEMHASCTIHTDHCLQLDR